MMSEAYKPIPCADHERLEFAVLRRLPLNLTYLDGTESVMARVLPVDVATRDGAEWLTFRDARGGESCIRLDRIQRIQSPD